MICVCDIFDLSGAIRERRIGLDPWLSYRPEEAAVYFKSLIGRVIPVLSARVRGVRTAKLCPVKGGMRLLLHHGVRLPCVSHRAIESWTEYRMHAFDVMSTRLRIHCVPSERVSKIEEGPDTESRRDEKGEIERASSE
jgi:hypothetical protein